MAILERHVQQVGNFAAYWERERKFKDVEDRVGGFPTKRYYNLIAGRDNTGTMEWNREWDSFAAMEAAYDKLFSDPEVVRLAESGLEIGLTERTEFYFIEEPH